MSWSLNTLKGATIAEARDMIAAAHAPQPIKDYILTGLENLVAQKGEDAKVDIYGHGHLCDDGVSSYTQTSATLTVKLSE
jgi:hypothetical protein